LKGEGPFWSTPSGKTLYLRGKRGFWGKPYIPNERKKEARSGIKRKIRRAPSALPREGSSPLTSFRRKYIESVRTVRKGGRGSISYGEEGGDRANFS